MVVMRDLVSDITGKVHKLTRYNTVHKIHKALGNVHKLHKVH